MKNKRYFFEIPIGEEFIYCGKKYIMEYKAFGGRCSIINCKTGTSIIIDEYNQED